MVPIGRREFVAASGLVAIAGCLARSDGSGEQTDDETAGGNSTDADSTGAGESGADGSESLPESLATVLDAVPTAVEDVELRQFYVAKPDPDDEANQATMGAGGEQVGLEAEDVDRGLTAIYGDVDGTIAVIAGDFDAGDPDPPERVAATVQDGLVVYATTEGGAWEAGLEAAEAAADDQEAGLDEEVPVETLFEPLAEMEFVAGVPSVDGETMPEDVSFDSDTVEALGFGTEADVEAREETVGYVAVFEEGESPDAAVIEELLLSDSDDSEIAPEDVTIETDDRRAKTTFTRDLPQSSLPDNSPDVYVGIVSERESDTVSLRVSGDESVDASNLEFRIDGEQAEPPWEDDATLEPDDRYEIDVQPMTHVAVLWIDPELEDVTQSLGGSVVGSGDAFEAQYDHEAHDLRLEYTVDRSLDPDRFQVVRRSEGISNEETTPLTEYVDSLEQGTEFVLPDVQYGEFVAVEMDVDDVSGHTSESVFWFSADPPGHFDLESEDGEHVLVFQSEEREVATESFRVLIDDDPADVQWSDVAETLTGGERLELDAETGDTVAVEYVDDGDSVEAFSRDVVPSADFEFDVGESTVEITHDGGDTIDADPLAVHVYPGGDGPDSDAFDEYDTVEEGDSITVEYESDDGDGSVSVAVLYDGSLVDHSQPDTGAENSDSDSSAGGDGSGSGDSAGD